MRKRVWFYNKRTLHKVKRAFVIETLVSDNWNQITHSLHLFFPFHTKVQGHGHTV